MGVCEIDTKPSQGSSTDDKWVTPPTPATPGVAHWLAEASACGPLQRHSQMSLGLRCRLSLAQHTTTVVWKSHLPSHM